MAPDPGPTDGRFSVAFPRRHWYPVTPSRVLRDKPVAFTIMDTPYVAFRDGSGRPRVLADRCPHRGVPLSLGRVSDGCLQCCYHGWRFDGDGACAAVPGLLTSDPAAVTRRVDVLAATESDGFVWAWTDPVHSPDGDPFRLPSFSGPGTGQTMFTYDLDCTMHAAMENALDVPHTAFLHRGIFRGAEPTKLEAVRRGIPGGVEVQYLGEPVGFNGMRAKSGQAATFDHWDRFFLPSVAQIEYRVAGWLRIVNTILHLPLSPFRTRAWFVVRWWSRLPAPVVKPIVLARGKQILRQDAWVLREQSEAARSHGSESYTSTELDLIGNAMWLMLRRSEKGEDPQLTEEEARVTFTV
jgi:phenylpropionate dioxygenase-like ring-hydroxylating dioxygenase large terminal subunit